MVLAALATAVAGTAVSYTFKQDPARANGLAQLPFSQDDIYRGWGYRGDTFPADPFHKGCDFGIGASNTPGTQVPAAAAGVITAVGQAPAIQGYVQIDHGPDAAGTRWWTRYHMLQPASLPAGQTIVSQGDFIGRIASQDGTSSGVHLHFEVNTSDGSLHTESYGSTVNPVDFIERVPNGGVADPLYPLSEEEIMPLILRQATGDTYSLFPHRIKHHQNPQDSAIAHYVRDASTVRDDLIEFNDADLRIVLHEFGFGDIAGDLNGRLPKNGAAVDRIDQIIAKLAAL